MRLQKQYVYTVSSSALVSMLDQQRPKSAAANQTMTPVSGRERQCPTIHTLKVSTVLLTKLSSTEELLNSDAALDKDELIVKTGEEQTVNSTISRISMKNNLSTGVSIGSGTFSVCAVVTSLSDNQYVPEPGGFLCVVYRVCAGQLC